MGEEFVVGDRIEWWRDIDGRPVAPGDPEAKKYSGTVESVHRRPSDDSPIIAYLVSCRDGVAGAGRATYQIVSDGWLC